jgi:hypothetical protein
MNVMSRVATDRPPLKLRRSAEALAKADYLPAFSRQGAFSALVLLVSLLLIGVGIRMPAATG